jgi:uncharacterized protein (TIGR03435 family)
MLAFSIMCLAALHAQPPHFDAASVKPGAAPPTGRAGGAGRGGRIQITPGRIAGAGVTARQIVLEAYRLRPYELSGGPSWIDSARFDMEGKAGTPATAEQLRAMLQTLLAERFQFAIHRETKEMPVYGLIIAKSGLKLHEVKEGEPKPPAPRAEPGAIMVEYSVQKMQDFVDNLSRIPEIGRPVLNQTGLEGVYAFDFQLHPDEDFVTMVQQRCGLKLESQRATVQIVVIDRIEKPAEN